jgi:Ca2+-binding RTX toxin-like protein
MIVVGHTRYLAALKLGLTEAPVHVATGLTLSGNDLNNSLIGSTSNDTLNGAGGNDIEPALSNLNQAA